MESKNSSTAWMHDQHVWDETLNAFASFEDGVQNQADTAGDAAMDPNASQQYRTDASNWATTEASHTHMQTGNHQRQDSSTTAPDTNMQNQINELREVVSNLITNKWHSPENSRPKRRATRLFESFSFNPSDQDQSRLTSGLTTPLDGLTSPFDYSDDSPIYSRRTSAASIGSLPTKRGPRILGGYACEKCNARFDIPGDLRHHERNHLTNEDRPHPCTQCGQRFLYPKDVTRHERQVHSMHKTDPDERLDAGAATPDKRREGQSATLRERRERKRQLLDSQAAMRSRRISWSTRQSRLSLEQRSQPSSQQPSRASSPEPRRDSAVPSITTEDADKVKLNLLLPDPDADLTQAVRDLQIQVATQQKTIGDLERSLQETKQNAETWLGERNALAQLLQQSTAAMSWPSQNQQAAGSLTTTDSVNADGITSVDFNQYIDFDLGEPH